MDGSVWRLPLVALVVCVAAAFVGAGMFWEAGWLSPVPPATDTLPAPEADVGEDRLLVLYQAAFTAWAALVLMIPAYVYVWQRNRGSWDRWRAWWAVSYAAFAVHMFVAMVLFFGGDVAAMRGSSRVSAFGPGVLLLIWWGLDVALSFAGREGLLLRLQRVLVHLLAFVLMVGGSLVKGEMLTIRGLGLVLFLAGLGFGLAWLMGRRRAQAHSG